jgi:hypothetical protein
MQVFLIASPFGVEENRLVLLLIKAKAVLG